MGQGQVLLPSNKSPTLQKVRSSVAQHVELARLGLVRSNDRVTDETMRRKIKDHDSLLAYSLGLSLPLVLFSAMDVLAYCEYYSRTHGRTVVEGITRVSASDAGTMVGNIREVFEKLGRRGEWRPVNAIGNPACSTEVRDWLAGYQKYLKRCGILPAGAVPIGDEKVAALMAWSYLKTYSLLPHCLRMSQNLSSHSRMRLLLFPKIQLS